MEPLVSIIIPSFHRQSDLVSRAIKSALAQTYKNLEVIVVDDNAGENDIDFRKSNQNLFKAIETKDKRIKLFLNDSRLGGALSRNVGIKEAKGKYIAFLDDDDYYKKDKINKQITFMLKHNINLSYTNLTIYDENYKIVDRRVRNETSNYSQEQLFKYHLMKNLTGTETLMFEKEFLKSIGSFDDVAMGHEYYLMAKALLSPNLKIGFYPSDDIVAFRTKNESISNGPKKIKGERDLYNFKKQYFNCLNKKEIRFLKFRHRAVMAVAYMRRKHYFASLFYLLVAFLTSPIISMSEFVHYKRNNKTSK